MVSRDILIRDAKCIGKDSVLLRESRKSWQPTASKSIQKPDFKTYSPQTTETETKRTKYTHLYPHPLRLLIRPPPLRRVIRPHLLPRLDPSLLSPPIALLRLLPRLLQIPLIILTPVVALHAPLIDAPSLIGLRLGARSTLFHSTIRQYRLGSRRLVAAGSLCPRG